MTQRVRREAMNRPGVSPQTADDTRFERIRQALLSSPIYLCIERPVLITEYFKRHDDPREPMIIRKARAFRYLMQNKSALIFPDELVVGNMGRHRKSALTQPELAGVFLSQDLLWIDRRSTAPFQISWKDRLTLALRVIPYWLPRNMVVRAFRGRLEHMLRYLTDQLSATYYLINEVAGIGHFLPNYDKMLRLGVRGYLASAENKQSDLYKAAEIACEGLVDYAGRLAVEAERQATGEPEGERRNELLEIARICRKVPAEPAETFHEAVQSLWLSHMGVCLEGFNSAVSFGRVDQYLYPYYRKDIERGALTHRQAKDILLSFSAKATEHVFLVSERSGKYHGGFLVAQAAVVGGIDSVGRDATNELSYRFLDVMAEAGLRDPNYQVRLHPETPAPFLKRAAEVAKLGKGVPAFFNDDAVVKALVRHGFPESEARNYGVVGCVEPSIPGRSFLSTDAALFNLPVCLELALNQGRRLRGKRRIGAATASPESFASMDDLVAAFKKQVEYMVARMMTDLRVIERGNRDFHPTPFSSMLIDGCLESGKDITAGGAIYNGSGIQGVGVADVADSLAALDQVVFREKKFSLACVVGAMRDNFVSDPILLAELQKAPKFGNDYPLPDGYADRVACCFHDILARYTNSRNGGCVPGFYSSTCHVAFGERTGALPSGRKAGEPFAASLGSCNGQDRLGPTALLNSVAKMDAGLAPNGYAVNLRFDPQTLDGDKGTAVLGALVDGFFKQGGMEVQFNIIDPKMLVDARDNPGKYPGLVVRVAGYCAYFEDLPTNVKDEIIARNRLRV